MTAIASTTAAHESLQSKGYVPVVAPLAAPVVAGQPPRLVWVRRFSPSSIAAVAFSFVAFVGLTAGAGYVCALVITKVITTFAGL